jgi:dTMP kinase
MGQRGVFITFEGGEGGGKSTQVKALHAALSVPAVLTREPGGTPAAEKIRAVLVQGNGALEPLTEALLLSAARHEHVVHKIRPALERGEWVISDRFCDSTRAMQGAGMGLDAAVIEHLCALATGGLVPDLTFIFDIDPELGLSRSTKRLSAEQTGEDRYERMSLAFHQRLRQGFLDIAAANPSRCVVIDAAQAPDVVAARVLDEVRRRWPGVLE